MAEVKKHITIGNIVALILGIIGLIWIIYVVWKNWKIRRIRNWPKAPATMINVLVEPLGGNKIYFDLQNIVAVVNGNGKYIPRVLYDYWVNGRKYTSGSLIYSGPRSYSLNDINAMFTKLQRGSTFAVYFNPNNPEEAYIFDGDTKYAGILGGLLLILAGAYLGYYHFNSIKKKKNNLSNGSQSLNDQADNKFFKYKAH